MTEHTYDKISQYEASIIIPPGVAGFELSWTRDVQRTELMGIFGWGRGGIAIAGPEVWTAKGIRIRDGQKIAGVGPDRATAERLLMEQLP